MRHSTLAYFYANLGIKLLRSPVKLQLIAVNLPQHFVANFIRVN